MNEGRATERGTVGAPSWDVIPDDAARTERVARMTSDRRFIEQAVRDTCGQSIRSIHRITEGFSNEVYGVTTTDGSRLVVRIHWWSTEPYFGPERWALEQCTAAGVPAPRILGILHVAADAKPRAVCIETALRGRTFESLLRLGDPSEADNQSILHQAGEILARLHGIAATGYGAIGDDGIGAHASPGSAIDALDSGQLYGAAHAQQIGASEIEQALAIVRDGLTAVPPRLLHGDLCPQHIMVDHGVVTGLIDFEFPQAGDPALDLAYWDHRQGSRVPITALLESYADPGIRRRMAIYRIQIGLSLLSYHGVRADDDTRFLEFIRRRLRHDIRAAI